MTNQEKYVNALRKITGNTNPEMHNGDLYVDAFAAIADGEGGGGGTGAFFVPLTFVREEDDDIYIFTSTVSPDTIVEKYAARIPMYFYGEIEGATRVIPVVSARKPDIDEHEIIGNYVIAEEDDAMIVPQIVYDDNSDEYVLSINEFKIPDIPDIPDPNDASERGMALISDKTDKYKFGWPVKIVDVKGTMVDEDTMALSNEDGKSVTASSLSDWVSKNAIIRVAVTISADTTVVYKVAGITEAIITEVDDGTTITTTVFDILADGHIFETDNLDGDDQVVFKRK